MTHKNTLSKALSNDDQLSSTMNTFIFFLSDGTGITVEMLGNSLISHFDTMKFIRIRRPYLKSTDAVKNVIKEINEFTNESNTTVLVFSTLISSESRALLEKCQCLLFDIDDIFIKPMEETLNVTSSKQVGLSHGMGSFDNYMQRIEALDFTIENDDGEKTKNYAMADIIIIGVSRSGKTPTSLYLALNHSMQTANYPLTTDDLSSEDLPAVLEKFKNKLFGLTINPTRLHHIRQQRKFNSRYAELSQCQYETRTAEALYNKFNIPFLDTSSMSIEEIATSILQNIKEPPVQS